MGRNMASSQQELDVLESWEEIDGTDVIEKQFKSIITPIDNKSNGLIKMPLNINLSGDDALRSYVPPQPTVKILKRSSQNTQLNDSTKIMQPKKTLQQREQEYAEARLRILGEESKSEEKYVCIQSKSRPNNTELDNVIRMPKGPDGTKGFNIRR